MQGDDESHLDQTDTELEKGWAFNTLDLEQQPHDVSLGCTHSPQPLRSGGVFAVVYWIMFGTAF